MKQFINQYSLSKTLRFELIPQGRTLENIEKKGLIAEDEKRAKNYKRMKEIIDDYHQDFIEKSLDNVELKTLQDFYDLYTKSNEEKKRDPKFKNNFEKSQKNLRKEIVDNFKRGDLGQVFSNLNKQDLIKKDLKLWMEKRNCYSSRDFEILDDFKNFTTYFVGFNENRQNMYSVEEKSTAIAYRIVNENLPKFIDNIKIYKKAKEFRIELDKIENNLDEKLPGISFDTVFSLDFFSKTLNQSQIDNYNCIIGGYTKNDGKTKVQGLNEIINLYNQKQIDRNHKIPKLKELYKQILSDREVRSYTAKAYDLDQELIDDVKEFYQKKKDYFDEINRIIQNINHSDLSKIYLKNDTNLTNISKKVFGDYAIIEIALERYFDQNLASNLNSKNLEKEKEKFLKIEYFDIQFLQNVIDDYLSTLDRNHRLAEFVNSNCLANYFDKYCIVDVGGVTMNLVANIENKYQNFSKILADKYSDNKTLNQNKDDVFLIKDFLDSAMEFLHFVKPLNLPKEFELEKDENFYSEFQSNFDQIESLIPIYNKVRNYVTKKPYQTKKIKLNFKNSTLLNGWDLGKESDNTSILLKKDGFYYLAIMDKSNNKIFRKIPKDQDFSEGFYEKIIYKLLPGPNKMLPKVFFSKKGLSFFKPSEELLRKYKNNTHTKGDNFDLDDCHNLIDFYKKSISKYESWKSFDFQFSDTKSYNDISAFYREVEHQGYKITFQNISKKLIDEFVEDGKLYLFKIHNKDFSANSKGNQNLHTIYWKALFEEKNLKNVIYKLNGEAEIFFREKSIADPTIHKANQPIANKNPYSENKQAIFKYDIIKDKRYTLDKFQFHVPITLNFKAIGNNYINRDVLAYLKNNPDVNIIGLDRGERHLIYLTLINQKGEILKQKSLNSVVDDKSKNITNYHDLLDKKESERKSARENWGVIENIKELKDGYLSQVIHELTKMMIENNAIIVLEDLNFGFKRGRFKVEKQIYQKLEKKLIDKLNYLVLKNKNANELGGAYNALQLSNKFTSFKKIGKQSGFLFYVPAWNTSKIDPTTGFVNLFNTKYENVHKSQDFFKKFTDISYNQNQDYFEFKVNNYSDFNKKAEGTRQDWIICTYGQRIISFRNREKNNNWDNKEIILSNEFKNHFTEFKIDFRSNLKNQIINQNSKEFYSKLLNLFKLTLQMRNSVTNSSIDYLISPVMNNDGEFYDSRNASDYLPKDADANGAYNIARKGLQLINQINEYESDDFSKFNFKNDNKSWLEFAQNQAKSKVKEQSKFEIVERKIQ